MWYSILVQSIGFIAIAMNIIAVQFNKHWPIMLFKSLGSFLFAVQYLLLGAFVGMAMDIVGVIRNFVFATNVKKNKNNFWWIILFSIITATIGVITIIFTWGKTLETLSRWSSNFSVLTIMAIGLSVLSILAKLLSTIGYGAKSPHAIRMINLPTFSMWIFYNVMVISIAGIISDSMSIVSIIIAEIRFKEKKVDKNLEKKDPNGIKETADESKISI